MRRRVIFFIVCIILWLLLTGTFAWQNTVAGVIAAFLAAFLFGNQFSGQAKNCCQITRYLWFLCYIPLFLWECVRANVDVAYRVLAPSMPINPGIVKIKTDLKTDIAKTFLANSITMTPGTLSVDIKDQYLYIHWINVRSQDCEQATKTIAGRFEALLKRIFE